MLDGITLLARDNLVNLGRNSYPGRGIVIGLDEAAKHFVMIYWIMGRSVGSRNRVFSLEPETGRLYTEAADPAKMEDPSLIIYNAMRERGDYFIVSNGAQTDKIADTGAPLDLHRALQTHQYEPDAPNFTPRITGICTRHSRRLIVQMAILRRSMMGDECDRVFYEFEPHRGFGYCLTTYSGDGNPLPPFRGDPLLMPLKGGLEEVAITFWQALNEPNRVSLAVKFIGVEDRKTRMRIINKYTKEV